MRSLMSGRQAALWSTLAFAAIAADWAGADEPPIYLFASEVVEFRHGAAPAHLGDFQATHLLGGVTATAGVLEADGTVAWMNGVTPGMGTFRGHSI
jgi:hypothetical protein